MYWLLSLAVRACTGFNAPTPLHTTPHPPRMAGGDAADLPATLRNPMAHRSGPRGGHALPPGLLQLCCLLVQSHVRKPPARLPLDWVEGVCWPQAGLTSPCSHQLFRECEAVAGYVLHAWIPLRSLCCLVREPVALGQAGGCMSHQWAAVLLHSKVFSPWSDRNAPNTPPFLASGAALGTHQLAGALPGGACAVPRAGGSGKGVGVAKSGPGGL